MSDVTMSSTNAHFPQMHLRCVVFLSHWDKCMELLVSVGAETIAPLVSRFSAKFHMMLHCDLIKMYLHNPTIPEGAGRNATQLLLLDTELKCADFSRADPFNS